MINNYVWIDKGVIEAHKRIRKHTCLTTPDLSEESLSDSNIYTNC